MQIEVKQLSKSFDRTSVVSDVHFSIRKGQLIGLLGPSGGGKTTILRLLAGLETPSSGEIYFDGQRVDRLPPQDRGIGFVFQNYALFKHMTVSENIEFGLRVQKKSRVEAAARVQELLELIGLQELAKRYPHQLSGGQRQRVAFARALAPAPQLLLLDEPFSAIDAKVRKELRDWLRDMITQLGVTSIFVTHDQEEAMAVADEIIVFNRGHIEQQGTPWEIFRHPATPFVASFIGETNAIEDLSLLEHLVSLDRIEAGSKVLVRPESIEIDRQQELAATGAALLGVVRNVQFRGSYWQVELQVGSQQLLAQRPLEQEPLRPGDQVSVILHRAHLFAGTENIILENSKREHRLNEHSLKEHSLKEHSFA